MPPWADGRGSMSDDRPALGRPVLLAHHEVAGAGRRRPVDAAQVVAVAVLADRLTSSSPCRAMSWACSPSEPTPELGRRFDDERVHGRQHDEVGGPLEHGVAVGQAERVLHLHPEGPEVVASAQVGADGIVDRRAPRPDGMRPTTNRGRSPRTYARRSSARKIGVVAVETFSNERVTWASCADADPPG